MTKEKAKQLLPIIQAFAEGKIIQLFKYDNIWKDCTSPDFSANVCDYRIKPEPREFWITVWNDDSMTTYKHKNNFLANQYKEQIHVREVID